MAAVSVFVDDAVRGRLPMVCARSGEPADYMVRTVQPVGGLPSAAWLLLLVGPPGWGLLLILLLLASGTEKLTVRIPRAEAGYEKERQMRRVTWGAALTGMACVGLAFLFASQAPGQAMVWLALAASFLVAAAVLLAMVNLRAIRISLDGSRRWVTLSGVHPDFVRAVERQEAGIHRP